MIMTRVPWLGVKSPQKCKGQEAEFHCKAVPSPNDIPVTGASDVMGGKVCLIWTNYHLFLKLISAVTAMPWEQSPRKYKRPKGIFHDISDVSLLRLRIEPSELRSVWMSWGSPELRALTSTKSTILLVRKKTQSLTNKDVLGRGYAPIRIMVALKWVALKLKKHFRVTVGTLWHGLSEKTGCLICYSTP